jgi:hypothetical protein
LEYQSDKKLDRIWDITFIFVVVLFLYSCFKNISTIFVGEIDDYSKIPYILDYRVEGFIQRGFIGTLINLINPEMSFADRMMLARIMYLIIGVLTVLFVILIALKIPKRFRRYAICFAVLFLASPGFTSYFGVALCRLDLYVFFIGVLIDYLILLIERYF